MARQHRERGVSATNLAKMMITQWSKIPTTVTITTSSFSLTGPVIPKLGFPQHADLEGNERNDSQQVCATWDEFLEHINTVEWYDETNDRHNKPITQWLVTCLFDNQSLHNVHHKADEFGIHGQRLNDGPHEQRRQWIHVHQLLHDDRQHLLSVNGLLTETQITRCTHGWPDTPVNKHSLTTRTIPLSRV